MKKIIKYCKHEHNIKFNCKTLQLGTFEYYRDMNPEFSIADYEEGTISYYIKNELNIGAPEFNAITSSGININDATNTGKNGKKVFGKTGFNGYYSTVWDKKNIATITLSNSFSIKYYYQNCYLFCTSMLDMAQSVNPKNVSSEYDSFYSIKFNQIVSFIDYISYEIKNQLKLEDIYLNSFNEKINNLSDLGNINIIGSAHLVEYLNDKKIYLKNKTDFINNGLHNLFTSSLLKKNIKYKNDSEYRFIFRVHSSKYGFISINKKPLILNLNPRIKTLLE